jgi:hypothetical protein
LDKAAQFIKKYLIRPLLWLVLVLFLLFAALLLAIRMPIVQNWALDKVAGYLTQVTKHEVKVGYINIAWLDELVLNDFVLYDRMKNEMIKVGKLHADFDLIAMLSTSEPAISDVWLYDPSVKTVMFQDNGDVNIMELIEAFSNLSSGSDTTTSTKPFVFHIDKVHLNNGSYTHYDEGEDGLPGGIFDYYHFTFHKVNAEISQLRIAGDTFEIQVAGLSCEERKTQLKVDELNTFYRICTKSMDLFDIEAKVGASNVHGNLQFFFETPGDLADFNQKATIKARIDSSIINMSELKYFVPPMWDIKEVFAISGGFDGRVEDFSLKNLDLRFGQSSLIKGDLRFSGLPELDQTFVNAKFKKLTSNFEDLEKYVGPETEVVLGRFGNISYTGSFVGFFTDFVTKGQFKTDLGNVESDINIKIKTDEEHSAYAGRLKTVNFQLGKLMDMSDLVGNVDLDGKIKGAGFSYAHAHFDLDAHVSRLGINQYDYRDIDVAANLMKGTFKGQVTSRDTNATFTLIGLLDFNRSPHFFDFEADVAHINLQKINVLDQPISFRTKVDMNIHGETLDDFQGDASFSHTFVGNGLKTIEIDTLKLVTEKLGDDRYVNLVSDLVEVNVDGNFSYNDLMDDLPRLYEEYLLVIENKKAKVTKYYEEARPYKSGDYNMNFSVWLRKSNPLIGLFTPRFKLADDTKLNGTFAKEAKKVDFTLVGSARKMEFDKVVFENCKLNYLSGKSLDHPFVNALGVFVSQKQRFTKSFKADGLGLQLMWNNDKVEFDLNLDQKNNENHIHANSMLTLKEGDVDVMFKNLDLKLLKTTWVGDSSHVIVKEDKVIVDKVLLKNDTQILLAEGIVSNDPEDELRLAVKDVSIRPFGAIFEKDLDGKVNGDFVFANVLSDNFKLDFDGGLTKFKVDKFLVGDIWGQTDWNAEKEQFDLDFTLTRDSVKNLDVQGFVKPFENNRLDLAAHLNQFKLKTLEPFVKDFVSDLRGGCDGDLKITGTLLQPNVTGKLRVDDGRFRFNYLNCSYLFSDVVTFDTAAIHLNRVTLKDTLGHVCHADGKIFHKKFRHFRFDIKSKFDHFLVLNTEDKHSDLFYGKVFASGKLAITGPVEDIKIDISAKNVGKSNIFIPLNMSESLGGHDFITFVKKKEVKKEEEEDEVVVEEKTKYLTTIGLDLDINPELEFQLILDKQTGDVITGTGSGSLKLNATTAGDFDLVGNYTFQKGKYNFTLLNLINKKFDITQGSSISWSGDPLGGILDIKASIEEKASLRDILPETDTAWFNHPSIRKRYPAVVNLSLKGDIQHPEIGYKIKIKDYPLTISDSKGSYQLDNYVRAFLQQLDVNEQQLNRQVFSLLVFRRFFPINNASSGLAGQGAAGTVSSLLSSQLSSMASQLDENLTVDIDLNGFDSQSLNDMRLRLSYVPDILDKRIRITRDGGFTNNQNRTTTASIAGDWSLEYMVTKDGMLRLKMFTRNNYNNVSSSLNNSNQTSTGFSFMHTQSFDNLSEIISKKKKEENNPSTEEEELPFADPEKEDDESPKQDAILNKEENEKQP